MNQWSTTKNQCTAGSPDFNIANAVSPTAAATSFANAAEVELPGGNDGTRRTFRLLRAKFTSGTQAARNSPFTITTSPASSSGNSPAISASNSRGFLELEVEGRIYEANNQVAIATSRIVREFIIEPKCCDRSFGGIIPNIPGLGNDSRTCAGNTNFPIGDLAIVTGIGGGGGLTGNSDSGALRVVDADGQKLESITCTRPEESESGTCDFREDALRTQNGDINYEIKPITIPSPPLLSSFPGAPTSGLTISLPRTIPLATDIIDPGDGTTSSRPCIEASLPPGSALAYHCKIDEINLQGNNQALTVNTTSDKPVYLYLQGNNENLAVGGQASIIHNHNGSIASISQANKLQIRGITKPADSACTSNQTFDLFGNASTAMFIWAPCATTNMRGTTDFGGIIWTNNLNFSGGGNGQIQLAIPSNPGVCVPGSSTVPCNVLEDTGNRLDESAPIDWAARSINFTRFF
jgi:hypothetical protein